MSYGFEFEWFAGCQIDEKTDYLGHDIKGLVGIKVENQEACAKRTALTKGALFWTYRDSDKKCWIKTSKKGKKANKTLVSGNRECGLQENEELKQGA